MSASGSDAPSPPAADPPFVEHDQKETLLPFGPGRVPLYVAIVWLGFIVAYFTVMSTLALPDLRKWMAH